jgi:hypothetical protein
MAHGAHVDDALCFAVYPQQGVHLVVEEGGHLAASEPEPDGRQREILRDVPRVEVDVPVGPLAVFPLRAREDGRPYAAAASEQNSWNNAARTRSPRKSPGATSSRRWPETP